MTAARLLLHEGICQTRAAALDGQGRAVQFYISSDFDKRPRLGDVLAGTIAKVSPMDGGCFVNLAGKAQGFLSRRSADGMVEGQRHMFRIVAEARADKLPRLQLANEGAMGDVETTHLQRWQSAIPGGDALAFETGRNVAQDIDAIFEDAQSSICAMERGGRLQIVPTPALIAIDVDTVGRQDKGRASARAKAINLDAAQTAARQIALRNLGGNIVLDCVAPLARAQGADIKSAFVDAFRAISTRKLSCLPPSPLGMMEATISHGARPLHDRLGGKLLDGLRAVEIEAVASPTRLMELSVPKPGYELYLSSKRRVDLALQERFGARIVIRESKTPEHGISDQ